MSAVDTSPSSPRRSSHKAHLHTMPVIFLEFLSTSLLVAVLPELQNAFFGDRAFIIVGISVGVKASSQSLSACADGCFLTGHSVVSLLASDRSAQRSRTLRLSLVQRLTVASMTAWTQMVHPCDMSALAGLQQLSARLLSLRSDWKHSARRVFAVHRQHVALCVSSFPAILIVQCA